MANPVYRTGKNDKFWCKQMEKFMLNPFIIIEYYLL